MNVIDSSAWLEFFESPKYGHLFEEVINQTNTLIVPTISIYEVFKKLYPQKGKDKAMETIGTMTGGYVTELDLALSIKAAKFSADNKLPMADSIIYVTAREYDATLWTMDSDLKDLPGVKYFAKK